MSLAPPAITGAIIGVGSAIFPGSQQLPKIAVAMGNSIPAWIPSPVNVLANGVTVGLSGGGTVQGKMFFSPGSFYPAGFTAAGYTGPTAPILGAAVEAGMAVALNAAAQYAGLSVGVSAGADVSKITRALALTLVPILAGNLTAAGISGPTMPQLALGLALGTSGLVLTGVGVGGVIPVAPAPAPGVGTSISIVF